MIIIWCFGVWFIFTMQTSLSLSLPLSSSRIESNVEQKKPSHWNPIWIQTKARTVNNSGNKIKRHRERNGKKYARSTVHQDSPRWDTHTQKKLHSLHTRSTQSKYYFDDDFYYRWFVSAVVVVSPSMDILLYMYFIFIIHKRRNNKRI